MLNLLYKTQRADGTSLQVTYPYIMAKIRVQARTEREEGYALPGAQPNAPGALGILRSVLKEQGVVGWYQVRGLH